MQQGMVRQLTVERRACPSNLICPLRGVLCLPDSPDTIEHRVVEIEGRIARAGEGIIGESSNSKVTSGVKDRLRLGISSPSVRRLLEAVDIVAFQEELDVALLGLFAPLKIDIPCEWAWIVVEGRGSDHLDSGVIDLCRIVGWDREGDHLGWLWVGRSESQIDLLRNLSTAHWGLLGCGDIQ